MRAHTKTAITDLAVEINEIHSHPLECLGIKLRIPLCHWRRKRNIIGYVVTLETRNDTGMVLLQLTLELLFAHAPIV